MPVYRRVMRSVVCFLREDAEDKALEWVLLFARHGFGKGPVVDKRPRIRGRDRDAPVATDCTFESQFSLSVGVFICLKQYLVVKMRVKWDFG